MVAGSSAFRFGTAAALATVIGIIILVDAVWCGMANLTITHVMSQAAKICGLWLVASAYLYFRRSDRLTELTTYVVLWALFSASAVVLTYLAATTNLPFRDTAYAAADRALHFDIGAWLAVMRDHPAFGTVLTLLYGTLIIQTSITVVWMAHTRTANRNAEFLAAAILSLLLTCVFSALMPAIGRDPASNPMATEAPAFVREILALRAGQPLTRSLSEMQGIVFFPSYHTILALLLIWAHRGLVTFWGVAFVNLLMLLSIPTVGNHYFIDVLGGAAVALACMAVVPVFLATLQRWLYTDLHQL